MFAEMFSAFAGLKPVAWLSLFALVALFGILFLCRKKWNVKMITYGAMCIALSFILSYIRILRLPQGGSVTPGSMLPMMLYAYVFGPGAGLAAGAVYGLLQLLQDFYIVNPISLLMDYVLAFAMMGLAGLSRRHLSLGAVYAGVARWFWHFLSGFIFFSAYAWSGWNPVLYSAAYNALVVFPDTAVCILIACIPAVRRFARRLREENRPKKA